MRPRALTGRRSALRPGYAEAHSNLGIVLDLLNRPADALASFAAAVEFDSGIKLGYNNLALALADLDRHEEAIRFFQLARQMDPDAPEPVYNESLVQLALGNFEQGWRDYEARWRVPDLKLHRHNFTQPMWDGRSDIAGKTILLHAEQGLGDTILFARFVERVAAKGARVVLAAPEPLAPLMRSISAVAQVFTSGDPLPDFDLHAPLGSLPLTFGARVETIGCETAYLRAPAESETIVSLEKSADRDRSWVFAGRAIPPIPTIATVLYHSRPSSGYSGFQASDSFPCSKISARGTVRFWLVTIISISRPFTKEEAWPIRRRSFRDSTW